MNHDGCRRPADQARRTSRRRAVFLPPVVMFAMLALAFAGSVVFAGSAAQAVEPSEMLSDPALESRARDISTGLRCLVCQNQSIDESNAQLAKDLRILVRERLVAGDSNQEVLDYVVTRYGEFILLKPPFKPSTYLLWFGPVLIVGLGIFAVFTVFRRRAALAAAAESTGVAVLNEDEKNRLAALLDETDTNTDSKDETGGPT